MWSANIVADHSTTDIASNSDHAERHVIREFIDFLLFHGWTGEFKNRRASSQECLRDHRRDGFFRRALTLAKQSIKS